MTSDFQTRVAVRESPRHPGRLWFGILGAPIAWFTYLSLVWAFVEFGCRIGLQHYQIAQFPALHVLVVAATAVALVVAIAAGLAALAEWQRVQANEEKLHGQNIAWQMNWFMSAVGVLSSVLFTAGIVLTFVPVFVLQTCGGAIG